MAHIGFIGMGNMGYAMLKCLLNEFKNEIVFSCPDVARCEQITSETGVKYEKNNADCATNAKYIILAVKPQVYDEVLNDIKDSLTDESILISLAPGITIGEVKAKLNKNVKVVRIMPNTPVLVGEGMTALCYEESEFESTELANIEKIFSSCGKTVKLPEKLMNTAVCASGSSPAYVYMFIEALADGAVKYGIARNDAYKMAAQTVLGAAKMVLETGEHPGKLKDNVCSPGGTTIKAVAALEEYGFRNSVIKATDACYEACNNVK